MRATGKRGVDVHGFARFQLPHRLYNTMPAACSLRLPTCPAIGIRTSESQRCA
jgi:hypothetical protein